MTNQKYCSEYTFLLIIRKAKYYYYNDKEKNPKRNYISISPKNILAKINLKNNFSPVE